VPIVARMRVRAETARVLITVKATPQPSEKYGDTSCVAGVRLDGDRPSWMRLYPIAFRWLDGASQFRKYDVIELEVRRRDSDSRRESYSPTQDSWSVIENLPPWKRRHEVLSQLEPTTTCELNHAAAKDGSSPSLGLVYPADLDTLEFEPHSKWSPQQIQKMQDRIDLESSALVPLSGAIPAILKEPRFKVRYRYRCADRRCKGHVGRILDWELTALQNRLRSSDAEVKESVAKKFHDQMFAADRHAGFFMGNFELAARRAKFSVLGVYWPHVDDTIPPAPTLF
jgi:hypothetical protein